MKLIDSTGATDIELTEALGREFMQRLRLTFAALIAACGCTGEGAAALARLLGIHRKLAWQIWRIVNAEDPLRIAAFVPTQRGLKPLLESAERCGVRAELIGDVQARVREFEEFVRLQSGDRKSFEMTMTSLGPEPDEASELQWRKAAFEGNSYTFGVRARTVFRSNVFYPASVSELGFAFIWGLVDLYRVRPNVAWRISKKKLVDDRGHGISLRQSPLSRNDQEVTGPSGVPLWSEFSSQPLPPFTRRSTPSGEIEDWMEATRVGKPGVVTCVTAETGKVELPRHRTADEQVHMIGGVLNTPSEWFVLDQFLHADLFGSVSPAAAVFSNLFGGEHASPQWRGNERLPISVAVRHLGRGPEAGYTVHVPRYVEMMARAFELLGCDAERFDLYRIVLQYPPIPATVAMWHDLPQAPAGT
ncbi:MAG: hypothetical protein JW819_00145 [Candidatus Krumholzibacteriota bacterium]|nr:hypothetical protein [Candidatus Krumholzibacteriota bacterium]